MSKSQRSIAEQMFVQNKIGFEIFLTSVIFWFGHMPLTLTPYDANEDDTYYFSAPIKSAYTHDYPHAPTHSQPHRARKTTKNVTGSHSKSHSRSHSTLLSHTNNDELKTALAQIEDKLQRMSSSVQYERTMLERLEDKIAHASIISGVKNVETSDSNDSNKHATIQQLFGIVNKLMADKISGKSKERERMCECEKCECEKCECEKCGCDCAGKRVRETKSGFASERVSNHVSGFSGSSSASEASTSIPLWQWVVIICSIVITVIVCVAIIFLLSKSSQNIYGRKT